MSGNLRTYIHEVVLPFLQRRSTTIPVILFEVKQTVSITYGGCSDKDLSQSLLEGLYTCVDYSANEVLVCLTSTYTWQFTALSK